MDANNTVLLSKLLHLSKKETDLLEKFNATEQKLFLNFIEKVYPRTVIFREGVEFEMEGENFCNPWAKSLGIFSFIINSKLKS